VVRKTIIQALFLSLDVAQRFTASKRFCHFLELFLRVHFTFYCAPWSAAVEHATARTLWMDFGSRWAAMSQSRAVTSGAADFSGQRAAPACMHGQSLLRKAEPRRASPKHVGSSAEKRSTHTFFLQDAKIFWAREHEDMS
jgi:hypothetical protein